MRTWLSLLAVGLGLLVALAVVMSGRVDPFSLAIALFLVAGGVRLWQRPRLRDPFDD